MDSWIELCMCVHIGTIYPGDRSATKRLSILIEFDFVICQAQSFLFLGFR